jgi:primosomal protein N' (replication factor Y)
MSRNPGLDTAGVLPILVATPAHSRLTGPLHYQSDQHHPAGTLVRVPLGQRDTLGLVWLSEASAAPPPDVRLRPILEAWTDLPPLDASWLSLVAFAASYYQRSLGELALNSLPPSLKSLRQATLERRLAALTPSSSPEAADAKTPLPTLTEEQATVLQLMASSNKPCLLHGSTGSGKTEVYLRRAAEVLASDPGAQVLIMVPEINLTPQLTQRVTDRFAELGEHAIVAMHSGLTPAQRLRSWLLAHTGRARVILGTRLAVLASIPRLKLIVVDEEHDPSYKQQEGARYSARDLAVYRGHLQQAQVVLGSATPSLESWHHSRPAVTGESAPRYQRLSMPTRVGQAAMPQWRRVDMGQQPKGTLVAPPLLSAMRERLQRGEQVLVLLNRRGYAPVLHCHDCGWKSDCPHCSAYRVFHKSDRSLRCHHCSLTQPVPRACPACGNHDIGALGHGTEKIEETLAGLLADVRRADGSALRIARIDADAARNPSELAQQLAQVHAGEVDLLVGTQMIAKGHDFRRVTMVAALNPDGALFSADFRAPERLFALLMQAAGRAGRDARLAAHEAGEMWVQTFHPTHPLFEKLKQHDVAGFIEQQLLERQQAGLPPFSHQALLRAEARSQEAAQAFLQAAMAQAHAWPELASGRVTIYPAIPMGMPRVANVERAQMLVESSARPALQQFLSEWHPVLHQLRDAHRSVIRWAIDVDPLVI